MRVRKMANTCPAVEVKPPTGCSFYLQKKKRYCRLLANENQKYCPEHSHLDTESAKTNENENRPLRITCPHDPKHTVYAHNLHKHLKICGAREPDVRPTYFKFNCNILSGPEPEVVKLKDLSEDSIKTLISKISNIFKDRVSEVKVYKHTVPQMHDVINSPENGQPARRHLTQIATIVDLVLGNPDSHKQDTVFVEFGSGKGHVSYWLGLTYKDVRPEENCRILLIDRESHRHKRDNKFAYDDCVNITRIRVDIKDLVLQKVAHVENSKAVVGISKHLCGQATDLALTCLLSDKQPNNVAGLVMAPCCHNRCTWTSFVGKEFLLEAGFEEKDFYPLIAVTSWAVCGTGTSKFDSATDDEIGTNPTYRNLGLTRGQRREIGYQAKKILDQARANFVERHGLKCRLTAFASEEDTLENILLHAER